MSKGREYSHSLNDEINLKLPEEIKTAMNLKGWNALGIYELVRDEKDKLAKGGKQRKIVIADRTAQNTNSHKESLKQISEPQL